MDGLEVCRRMRAASDETPVLMLTARGRRHRPGGRLDAGADDYLVKPFSFDELLARMRALFRRARPTGTSAPEVLRFADLVLDTGTRRATRNDG
jgi:two-component system response regulator MprA